MIQQTAFSQVYEENDEPVNNDVDDQRKDEKMLGIDAIHHGFWQNHHVSSVRK